MTRYVKKPVVVDAYHHVRDGSSYPEWLQIQHGRGNMAEMPDGSIHVLTDTGQLVAVPLDYWIIQGVNGELYPCAPDVFEQTYDATTVADTWQNRLLDENRQLTDRIQKLESGINKAPKDQHPLLLEQLNAMLVYKAVLDERCKTL